MKSEHLFIIRLGDGRHFEYEGTLDGAKRKASKLATPPVTAFSGSAAFWSCRRTTLCGMRSG